MVAISPALLSESATHTARRHASKRAGRPRRATKEQRLHFAVAEALEARTMLSATHLAFAIQPSDTTAGDGLSSVTVNVEDSNNAIVAGDHSLVTFSIATGPAGADPLFFAVPAVNGVATLSGLSFTVAGGYTLLASDGALTPATSSAFTINPDVADHLSFTAQPGNTTAGSTLSTITVAIEDQFNNVVTSDTSNVVIALASGSATLGGTKTVAAVNGVATFSTLSLTQTGSYTLGVTDGGLSTDTSGGFAISPDVASQLVITTQPSSTTAGLTISNIIAKIEDQYGNVVTSDNSNVTIAVNTGSGTLGGTKTVAASSGVATFSTLSITKADNYTLILSDGSLSTATTNSITISPDTASKLVVTQQPNNVTAGTLSNVKVSIEDQYNNVITGNTSNVTIALASGSATLGGTKTVAAVAGVATFTTLSITTSGDYTLGATDGGLSGVTSGSFTVNPDVASQVVITTGPTNTVAGQTIASIIAKIEDQYGNVVTTDTSAVDIAVASGSGSLIGTTSRNAVAGVATFSGLSITTADAYTLNVTDGALTDATSGSFTISPDAASQLVITTDASNTVAGQTISNIVAKVEDQYGNVVTTDTSSVTIAIASGTGTLLGTKTLNAVAGVATFSTLSIQRTGSFTLSITDGSLTAATTSSFAITPDAASKLVFTTQPASGNAGALNSVVVKVEDQYNNVVTTDTSNIVIAMASGGGTLLGTKTVAAVAGVATFGALGIHTPGTFTLGVTDGGLTVDTSASFTITPDVASQVVFTTQPADGSAGNLNTVVVKVEDQYGNVVTTDTSSVTVALASGTGSLLGTKTVNAVAGIATFSTLGIHSPDTFTLSANDGSLSADTSASFTITPAAASQLVITTQPTTTVAGQTISNIVVKVEDQYGNVVTTDSSNVTIALASGSGSLTGTDTVAATNGIATFNDLALFQSGNFTLGVTDGSLSVATSGSFTISPDVANQLEVVQQPTTTAAGQTISSIIVRVEDQYGNVVTTDSSNVVIAIDTGSGTLSGTKTIAAVNGVATFSTLSIATTGAFTLGVTDGALNADVTGSFNITSAPATHLTITTGPTNTVAGQTISSIIVEVRDQYDNVVTTDSSNVVIALASGSGSLGGTKTIAAVNGVATFGTLFSNTAGAKTLSVTDGSLTTATSGSFTISPDAASQLIITTQPTTTVAGQTISNIIAKIEDQFGNVVTTDTSNVTIAIASGPGAPGFTGTKTVAAVSGVATFSTLAITKTGSYTMSVTDGALNADTTSSFSITPDAATHLVFTTQPGNTTAGSLGTVVAKVEDQYGNVVTTDTSTVTLDIASGAGGLLGTKAVAAVAGVATFGSLAIHVADDYTLSGDDGSLTGDTSASFTISPDVASQLVITTQPTDTVAGQTISNIVAKIEDQYGNIESTDTSNVTIGVATGTGSLTGTKTVAAVAGVATFSTLSMTVAGSKSLTVTDGSLSSATTNAFAISPDVPSQVVITTGPTNTVAGQTIASIIAKIEDQYGNVVTTDTSAVDIAVASGSGSLIGTTSRNAVAGVATFSGLSITTADAYTLNVTDGALTDATSGSFTISPDAASQLVITTDASNTVAGQTISNIVAKVEDQYGNVVTTDTSSVTIAIASGTGTLLGTKTLNAVAGVATFSTLSIQRTGSFTLSITDGSLTAATTSSFAITPDAASKLVFTTQPASGNAGALNSVVVKVEDQYNNVVTTDTSNIVIAMASGGGTLLGTKTVAAVAGVATFGALGIHTPGTFTLGVTDGGLTVDTSASFTITPDVASQVVFTTQPADGSAGNLNTVVVKVEDQYGNVVTTDTSSVTVALASGTGSLLGTKTVNAVAGIATFSTLGIHSPDTFTLSANDGSLSADTSASFTITPAAASQLVITTQPTTTVAGQTISNIVVKVEDQYGNVVTTDSSNVVIAIASGSATLNGTKTVAASSGVATFSTLNITATGSYTLGVTDGGLTVATSSSFAITPDAATHLVITTQPSSTSAGALNSVVVRVEDQYNNVVTTDTSAIDIAMASGGGTLLGTTSVNAVGGIATFSALAIHTPGTFTLSVSDGGLTIDTSASFTITPAAASQTVFTTQPGNISAGALGTVVVKVEDQYGNVVTTDSSTITLNMNSGGGTLLGTTSAAAVNGVATFGAVTIHTAGTFTLSASDGSLSAGVSNSFTVSPTAATHLAFTSQPNSMVAGNLLTGINASVEDQYNNVVTSSSVNVTFTVTGGGSTFNFVVAASSGVATLNSIYLVKAGAYSVHAAKSGLTAADSNTITVTPDVASKLVITTQPTNTVAGQTISNIVVKVEDQFDNVVTTDSSSIVMAIGSGTGTLNGTKTVAASSGVATFSTLSINQAGAFTLGVSDGSLTADTSSSINITPAAASQVVITTQPTNTVAGQTISNVVAKVEDQYGNIVTTDTSNVTIALATGTGTLSGTKTVAAVAGVATFSTLSMTAAGAKTYTITDGGLTSATTSNITITPDAASKAVFTSQPANGAAGSLNTVVVKVEDQYGNVVTTDSSTVDIAIASGTGSLLGTTSVNAVAGVATFSTLGIHSPDTFTLSATDGALTQDTSASFTITPAAASQLVITTDASDTVAGQTISSIVAKVEDQYGNVVTTDTSSVTIAIASGTGTLLGTKTLNAVAGVATFSTLSIQRTGSFTLSITDGSLTAATTSSFAITPDSASKLVFTTQPANGAAGALNSVVVKVEDQYNNVVTSDTSNVVIAMASGGGTLLGTKTVAAVAGVATFGALGIHTPGTFTLGVTDGGLAVDTSASFTITPDVASQVVFTTQPADGSAGNLNTVVVKVEDQYGNVVTTDTSSVTVALASGTGSLLGTKTVNAVAGIATFSTLGIHSPDTFTLSANDGSLSADTSAGFTITAAAASQLVITTQPTTTVAGQTISNIVVKVEDQYGNVVTTDSSNVVIAIASGSATLNGTKTVAASSGVATFSTLNITATGSYTLGVTDGGLTIATSSSFAITPDAATHLAITTQPTNTVAGQTVTVVAKVEDQYGNVVTTDSSNVTIALASGAATLNGTLIVAASNGVATFNTLNITTTGAYTLGVTDGSLTADTSGSFSITPAAASQLVITTQPTNTVAGQTISNIVVKVEDQYGNVVTTDSSNVVIAIASGTGTLLGTKTIVASSGVATFSTLSIQRTGSFTLSVTDGSLTAATSSSITISPDTASKLVITQQPTATNAGQSISSIIVAVEDQYGNVVTTDSSNVTIAIASGSATLNGTKTVAASSGIATFSTLNITTPGTYTLGVTDGALTTDTSSSLVISPNVATKVVFTTQPASGNAGGLNTVVAMVEDQYGNVVTTDTSTITLAIASGSGSLLGTTSVNAVAGIAFFTTLGIHTVGTYTLSATDGSLTADTSASFTITPAAASQLVFTQQPANAVAGNLLSTVVVKVEDQYGNVVTTDSSNVNMSLNSGGNSVSLIVAASSGVATFSGIALLHTGTFTFHAADGSLTTANSSSFTISPDTASQLVFTTQPSNGAAGTLSTIAVSVEDQYGNVVTTDGSTVAIAIASGSGTLLGTASVAAVNGVATFSTLGIHTPGTFTLGVTDGSLTAATSTSFAITAAAASQLVITTQPTNTVAGQTISNIVAKVEDQYGNVVTTDSSNVTIAVASGTGTLGGTKTVAAVNGVATFSTLSLTAAGSFTLGVTDGSLTAATTSSFAISAAAASQLVITTQPTNTVAGQTISTIVAKVEDQYGNVVTTDSSSVTIAIASGSATLNGTKTVAASSGVATFSTLNITTTGSYTLGVTDGSLTAATSSSFAITPDAATHLVFTTQPSNGSAGSLSALVVSVEDQYNNVVTTDSSSVTIALASGSATLGGTKTVAAVNGVATFSALSLTTSGTYTLGVTDGSLTAATSSSFVISAAAASKLVITQQPTTTVAGQSISSILVTVEDQYNNVVTTDSSSVTIAIASGSATLNGTKTVAASSGVATFSTLNITKSGSYTLGVTDGALTTNTTSSFSITPAAASKLAITTQPSNVSAGSLGTIAVSVEDQYNNVVTTDSSSVTIAITSGSGTLGGTKTIAASSGVATFSGLSITTAGSYTLGVTDGSLTADTSSSFAISAAAASKLVITTQPTNTTAGSAISSIVAKVEDQYGNVVTTDSSNVTIALASGSATLNGTKTVAASNGIATFSALNITTAGSYTLGVTDGSLTTDTSSSFAISAAAASQLVITTQPTTTVAGQTISNIVAKVEDQYGNVVTTDSSNVTIAIASGSATLNGTKTVAASSGVATFSTLNVTKTGSYTLGVTDGSLTAATTSSFSITPDAATHLAVTAQPSNGSAGTLGSIAVSVEDQYNNVVTTDTSAVTMAIASGPGSLLGTTSVNAVAGVATFSALGIHTSGTYTLGATDGSLTAATTSSFAISAAAASKLVITQQPTTAVAGQSISSILVTVEDQYNNVVTTDSSNVTIALASGSATLNGTKTVAASSGIATFSALNITKTGSYTLGVTDASLTTDTSSSFSITPAAAAKLAITQQPTATVAGQSISAIIAAVEDQYGNVVTTDSSNVTIALASGSATLNGTKTVAASSGIATFSALNITKTGSYTLGVTDASLTTDTSSSFAITPDAATHLVITQQPGNTTAGSTISSIIAKIEDQYGNVVTTDSSNVTIAIASGSATLNGTKTVAASSGVATFSTLNITKTGSYTLGVTDGSLSTDTTSSFTISAAAASKLAVTQQPTDTVAGQTISTIIAKVEDQYGNVVTTNSSNVTIALASGSATLTGTKTVAASSGVATFSGLSMTKTGSYTLGVTDGSLTTDTTSGFAITPDAASQILLSFPDSAIAGDTIGSIVATIADQYGNTVTTDTSDVTVSFGSLASLTGTTTVAAVNGVANFDDLSITAAGLYSFGVFDGSLSKLQFSALTITPDTASQVVITQQPVDKNAGQTFSVIANIEDRFGNVVMTDTSSVTIGVATGSGSLGGTQTVNAVNGVATFSGLSLTAADDYTLDVSDGSLADAISDGFTISHAAASKLVITQQPGTQASRTLGTMTVEVEDQYGNVVTNDNSNVTVALANGVTTLGGSLTAPVSNGVATFPDLTVSSNGNFLLRVSDGSLTQDTSDPFSIGAKLVFQKQPATTVAGVTIGPILRVLIEDAAGRLLTGEDSTVTLAITTGPGSLGGTVSVDAVNGIASFDDLSITQTGSYKLTASDPGLNSATSVAFSITPAAATQMVLLQDASDVIAGVKMGPAVRVQLLDTFGNVAVNNHSTVTMSIASGPGGGTLSGTVTAVVTNGIATFSNLVLKKAGTYTLHAANASLSIDTASVDVTAAAAKKLVFIQQPTATTTNSTISPGIVVEVQDAFGNIIANNTANVSISLQSGPTGTAFTQTTAAVNGHASFSALAFSKKGTYKIKATSAGLTLVVSNAFIISLPSGGTH